MRGSFEQFIASLASIAGLGLTAALLMLASWLVAKWLGRVGRPDLGAYETPWGDVVELPAAAKGGGSRSAATGSHKGHGIARHDGTAL